MTFNEFIALHDINIRNSSHEEVIQLFFPYLRSVSGNERLLPDLLERIIGINLSSATVTTACFNGVNDGSVAPYDDVDLYIKLSNDIKIFVHGKPVDCTAKLNANEYIVMISSTTNNRAIPNRHISINKCSLPR